MRWLLVGYIYLYIHRPFEIWPVLGPLRIELLYMLFVGAVWLAYPGKRLLWGPQHLAFAALAAVVGLSWLASPFPDAGLVQVDAYFKQLVFYVMLVTVVHEEAILKTLIKAFLLLMTFYLLHSMWEFLNGRHVFRMGIPRMMGVDETLREPNTFAASIVYSLPLVVPFWRCRDAGLPRWFLVGYVGLASLCVILSGSRTGFVGLIAVVVLVGLTRRNWWRLLLPAVALSPLLWVVMPDYLQSRFETIVNPDAGPANAKSSAEGRIEGFRDGFVLLERSPLLGVGPDAFGVATGSGAKAHNLIGQTAGELGLLGLLALCLVLASFASNARSLRRLERAGDGQPPSFSHHLVRSVTLAVLLLLILGLAGHNLYRFTWHWYGAFQIIALHCARTRVVESQEPAWEPWPTLQPAGA